MELSVHLKERFFGEREQPLVEFGGLRATAFTYTTGVEGLRLENEQGSVELLPYQGQQIWRMTMCGRELTMKTVFDEPRRTREFLATYGGFLVHCGLSAIGVPTEADTHPLHGELPNAPYEAAWLLCGEDETGKYIALCGRYRDTVGFDRDYAFLPECRLYEGATTVKQTVTIQNLRSQPLEYSYLAHINFLPIDRSRLVASAVFDQETPVIHHDIPDKLPAEKRKRLAGYLDALERDRTLQNTVDSRSQCYEPEIVFTLRCIADEQGDAHSMQLLPDGGAFYVRHRPDELPVGLRWIARNGDDDALGLMLPATGEHKGYLHCREKGYLRYVPPQGEVGFHYEFGYLPPARASEVEGKIKGLTD